MAHQVNTSGGGGAEEGSQARHSTDILQYFQNQLGAPGHAGGSHPVMASPMFAQDPAVMAAMFGGAIPPPAAGVGMAAAALHPAYMFNPYLNPYFASFPAISQHNFLAQQQEQALDIVKSRSVNDSDTKTNKKKTTKKKKGNKSDIVQGDSNHVMMTPGVNTDPVVNGSVDNMVNSEAQHLGATKKKRKKKPPKKIVGDVIAQGGNDSLSPWQDGDSSPRGKQESQTSIPNGETLQMDNKGGVGNQSSNCEDVVSQPCTAQDNCDGQTLCSDKPSADSDTPMLSSVNEDTNNQISDHRGSSVTPINTEPPTVDNIQNVDNDTQVAQEQNNTVSKGTESSGSVGEIPSSQPQDNSPTPNDNPADCCHSLQVEMVGQATCDTENEPKVETQSATVEDTEKNEEVVIDVSKPVTESADSNGGASAVSSHQQHSTEDHTNNDKTNLASVNTDKVNDLVRPPGQSSFNDPTASNEQIPTTNGLIQEQHVEQSQVSSVEHRVGQLQTSSVEHVGQLKENSAEQTQMNTCEPNIGQLQTNAIEQNIGQLQTNAIEQNIGQLQENSFEQHVAHLQTNSIEGVPSSEVPKIKKKKKKKKKMINGDVLSPENDLAVFGQSAGMNLLNHDHMNHFSSNEKKIVTSEDVDNIVLPAPDVSDIKSCIRIDDPSAEPVKKKRPPKKKKVPTATLR